MTVIVEAQQIFEDVKSESKGIHSFSSPPKETPYKNNRTQKQEQIPLIIYFLTDNFNFVGISDIYLFFELRGNI